jgi:hypothetical protein
VISAQAELIERHAANAGVAMAEVNIAGSMAMIAATLVTGPLVASRLTWRTALVIPVAALVVVQLLSRRAEFSRTGRGRAPRRPVMNGRCGCCRGWASARPVRVGRSWLWGAEYLAEVGPSLGEGLGRVGDDAFSSVSLSGG